ncbi:MAG: mRNA cleavage and polyadenylation factor subunit [Chrysothrix sp. TS-e1954]|nr:MAG: mRNA cleavage and polyadenylation factor subunit [Chrysothrix sp. TS-e1954]
MQAYTEILPPTAVSHAICLPFVDSSSPVLVVAKTSLLQLFEVKEARNISYGQESPKSRVSNGHVETAGWVDQQHGQKLCLLAEYYLAGTITSLAGVKTTSTRSGGHALLVSFKDAKVSLVEWDPETHGLSTISLHLYEGEDIQSTPWSSDISEYPSKLFVDPGGRCAALRYDRGSLAVLNIRHPGDDLVMDDYDSDLDGEKPQRKGSAIVNGDKDSNQTLLSSSSVLPLKALDPDLTHAIDLAFLHEYREPTLGVLSSSIGSSYALLQQRKDVLKYTVFTLDVGQHARTPLLSVSGLPSDLSQLVPLSMPIGGTLLIGGNEFVHVDQAGKTHAVGVNNFARQCSSFAMHDQSDLAMRLEGCVVQPTGTTSGDLFVVLQTGELATLSFTMDGRSIAGLTASRVSIDKGGHVLRASASCSALIERGVVFVGSIEGDSCLLSCGQQRPALSRKRSRAEALGIDAMASDDDESIDEEDDDDLYGDDVVSPKRVGSSSAFGSLGQVTFTVSDELKNLSFASQPAVVRAVVAGDQKLADQPLDLIYPSASRRTADLNVLSSKMRPHFLARLREGPLRNVWTVTQTLSTETSSSQHVDAASANCDDFVITAQTTDGDTESSRIYRIKDNSLAEVQGSEFEIDTDTLDVGTLGSGTKIVHVSKSELRCYDKNLALAQMLPMVDEETDDELKITQSSFLDPYLLLLRDDASAIILQLDDKGELDEVERSKDFASSRWISGSLHRAGVYSSQILLYLLSREGVLQVYALPDLSRPTYVAPGLSRLPQILSPDFSPRRSSPQEAIREIMVADLGDQFDSQLHLIVRTIDDEIIVYRPFHHPSRETATTFTKNLRWLKLALPSMGGRSVQQTGNLEAPDDQWAPLRRLSCSNDTHAVFIPTTRPSMLLKSSTSLPTFVQTSAKAVAALPQSTVKSGNDRAWVMADPDGSLSLVQLPRETSYDHNGWTLRRVNVGQEVDAICHCSATNHIAVASSHPTDFALPEDDYHHEWAQEETSFHPSLSQGVIKLLSGTSYETVDEVPLEDDEVALCMQDAFLEVSESTHERKNLLAVGTAVVRGEDLATSGAIYIFEVIDVVPEPDRPETGKKLKQVTRESTKGAVTALCEVTSHGFLLVAQGQKCMVRGLKEDGSLLPVAFMDMQCYVSVLKNLQGTGMTIMGDAIKGLWFTGFADEPFKLAMFGKSQGRLPVMAADFLPHEKQLYLVVADNDQNLIVLEYNPDNASSLSGQRLIHRSTFHCGHQTASMLLLSKPEKTSPSLSNGNATSSDHVNGDAMDVDHDNSKAKSLHQVLFTSSSGALGLLTPLTEAAYRRLGVLQTFLTSTLDHACGLNPRAYRAVHDAEGLASRGVLDGGLLCRWPELNTQRRTDLWGRLGHEKDAVLDDIGMLRGDHLI